MSSNNTFIQQLLLLILLFTLTPQTHTQESNNNFCGTTWDDASSNCAERQHCPSGTDSECETSGHICFGGTTCDVTKGDGAKFKFANVPYNDISNTRFCGGSWDEALNGCSVESHCPSGYNDECPGDLSCYGGLGCNVKDLIEEEEEKAAAAAANVGVTAQRIPQNDPRRKQFCGISWGSASAACSNWCPNADDSECPPGQTCFGDTSCYYSDDIVPTESPTETQSEPPTTRAPSVYKDPSNRRFCGKNWGLANDLCSIETSCASGSDEDCPKGESCHGGTTCNLIDLLIKAETPDGLPTLKPTMPPREDQSNMRFCGESWDSAAASCSLETHCPDGNCPEGQICYGGTKCNAYDLTHQPTISPSVSPTTSPTHKPTGPTQSPTDGPPTTEAPVTQSPTISPKPTEAPSIFIPEDDIRHSFWCGTSWNDVVTNCRLACTSGEDDECPSGETCFAFTTCRPAPKPTVPLNSRPIKVPTAAPVPVDNTEEEATIDESSTSEVEEEANVSTLSPSQNTIESEVVSSISSTPANDSDFEAEAVNIDSNEETIVSESPSQNTIESEVVSPTSTPANDSDVQAEVVNIDSNEEAIESENLNQSNNTPINNIINNETESIGGSPQTASPVIDINTTSPVPAPIMDKLWKMTESPTTQTTPLIWTDTETNAPSVWVNVKTRSPTDSPSILDTVEDTSSPTPVPSLRRIDESKTHSIPVPSPALVSKIGSILKASKLRVTTDILLSMDRNTDVETPTTMYQYDGFLNALSVFSMSLLGSSYFYFGDDSGSINYGLVNAALFLAHATIETVRFDICDDVSWEKDVFGYFPLSNACGQGGLAGMSSVSYEHSYQCKEDEKHMACAVDPNMKSKATTNSGWTGAPPPLECFPKTSSSLVTGAWNPTLSCEQDGCDKYEDHTIGAIDPCRTPAQNSFGRTDVQGCCWWGRGPFPRGTSGTCKLGKLNYFLGRGSSQARYNIDFCKTPEAVCNKNSGDDIQNAEIRWIMGLLYWVDDVQVYNKNGWSYISKIHEFVDGGLSDETIFDAISTIITRGCHDCGKPISNDDRRAKFNAIVSIFGDVQAGVTPVPSKSPTSGPSSKIVSDSPTVNVFSTDTPISLAPIAFSPAPSHTPSLPANTQVTILSTADSPLSSIDITITQEELTNRLGHVNNFCASSLQDAEENCSKKLVTCNDDDPPCALGTACFGNILCNSSGDIVQDADRDNTNPPVVSDENISEYPSYSPSAIQLFVPVLCGDICLRPLVPVECISLGNSILILSDCVSVGVGQHCQSLGECGPNALIRNCRAHNVFMRALPADCLQNTSPQPTPAAVDLSDILAEQTSQYTQQDYGSIENTWWTDVVFNSSSKMSISLISLVIVSFIFLHLSY